MTIFKLFVCILICTAQSWPGTSADPDLILTPLIKAGKLDKAREMATDNIKLSHIKTSLNRPLISYSGYLTVNETYNSNLFFWLFPAMNNPETAPVIVATENIPGVSILQEVFLDNGPLYLDDKNEIKDREYSWARTHTMIYLDTPVGSGFSFTDSENGYATSAVDEELEVYEALVQLFTLFPEYRSKKLYMAGSGYAGRVIPRIVKHFQKQTSVNKDNFKIQITGVILGSPWVAPALQVQLSEILLGVGLISAEQSAMLLKEETILQGLVNAKKYDEVSPQNFKIHMIPGSMVWNMTGFSDDKSMLYSTSPAAVLQFAKFVDSKELHNYLHVGYHKYKIFNDEIFRKYYGDMGHNDLEPLEMLMDSEIKVLIYAPQFDMLVPRLGIERLLKALNWKGKEEFLKAGRIIWKVGEDVAGYVKSSGNFNYVVLRNSGFNAVMDQRKWCHDMVRRFTTGSLSI